MVCGNFILPEPASYVFFYAIFNLRNLLYIILVCARLRHVAGTQWGNKKYMNMKHLEAALDDASIAG